MTSLFSHYHIGSITTRETHPIVEGLYQTLEVWQLFSVCVCVCVFIYVYSYIHNNLAFKVRVYCTRHTKTYTSPNTIRTDISIKSTGSNSCT